MSQSDLHSPTFEDFELLAEVSQLLTLLDVDRVLEQVMSLAARAVGATQCTLMLHDGVQVDWNHVFLARQLTPDQSYHTVHSVLDKGLAGWVYRHKQGAIIEDTQNDARWITFPDDQLPVRSALCAPLMHEGDVIAVVTLVHPEPNHFSAYHLRLMTIIANQSAVAVRNAQLFTRLQLQQRQIQAVLQALPDVMFVLDDNSAIINVNDAALAFLGLAESTQVLGRPLSDFREASSTLTPVLEVVGQMNNQRAWSFEARSERRGKDYQITVTVWRDVQRDLAGYVVVMHDISTLRDLNRFKDEMLSIASHDLRSPLALIIGYADMLATDLPPNSEEQDYAETIRRSGERMNGLLDDLLRVEQVRRSPLELREQVNMAVLVKDAVEAMTPQAEHKKHTLTHHIELANLPRMIADPGLLRRAMENLIGNAIKYTPEGGRIHVHAMMRDQRFYYEVQDNGIGISAEHLPRVFEQFYRVKDVRVGSVGGFGLGLNLVRNIIERHHGEVWVQSEIDVGSKFGFWLPIL
jgi:PAS domain S-box-containing protein